MVTQTWGNHGRLLCEMERTECQCITVVYLPKCRKQLRNVWRTTPTLQQGKQEGRSANARQQECKQAVVSRSNHETCKKKKKKCEKSWPPLISLVVAELPEVRKLLLLLDIICLPIRVNRLRHTRTKSMTLQQLKCTWHLVALFLWCVNDSLKRMCTKK